MEIISLIADVFSLISAGITVFSAFKIKDYYKKIANQYSIEKITVSENYIHKAINNIQSLKKIYLNYSRGLGTDKISQLYIDIDNTLNEITFTIPPTYNDILNKINKAKKLIKSATTEKNISNRSEYFDSLDTLLSTINLELRKKKENIRENSVK